MRNAGNQDGNAGNHGGVAGNHGGNARIGMGKAKVRAREYICNGLFMKTDL